MTQHWFDTSKHPLHTLVFPARYTYEEVDAQMSFMRDHYRRVVKEHPHELYVLLVDLSRIEHSEPRNRKRIAEGIGDLTELMRKRIVAQAYVTDRPMIRAALTAVSWLQPLPWPVQVLPRAEPAKAWLYERLSEGRAAHR